MNVPGHIAIALIQDRLFNLSEERPRQVAFLAMATFFPDVVDKAIGYLFHLMPSGRHYAHNLFSLLLTSIIVTATQGKSAGYVWTIGYGAHLLADSGSFVPWFFPFKKYIFFKKQWRPFETIPFLKETIFLILTLVLTRRTKLNFSRCRTNC